MHVLDLKTEEVLQRFDSRPKNIGDLAVSGDGRLVVTGQGIARWIQLQCGIAYAKRR